MNWLNPHFVAKFLIAWSLVSLLCALFVGACIAAGAEEDPNDP